jgi:2-desacetyl-2-hydroxyethyl bacteriochlorophyllide A dehydrogenase
MKALVYSEINQMTMGMRPEPVPGPDDVLLRVSGTGICGSDLAGFLGLSPRRKPPLVLGHEAIGIVEKMPANPPPYADSWPFRVGGRVVVNPIVPCGTCEACRLGKINICTHWQLLGMDHIDGAFADLVKIKATNVFPIPESLPDNRAVMIEPLANGVHLFTLISASCPGTLAIFGAGTQGCLMLSLARLLGYRNVAMVDLNEARLDVASKLGARWAIDASKTDAVAEIRTLFGGHGADVVIDAHGNEAVRASCVGAARKGGEVLLLGLHTVNSSIDFAAVVRNELRLQGSYAFTAADFARSKALIESGEIDLSAWTETLPLEEGDAAFHRLTTNPGSTMKIVLTPGS